MRIAFRRAAVSAAVSLAFSPLLAQTFQGALKGTVLDPSGAVVSHATLELANPLTNTKTVITSNGAGEFNFAEVPVGRYTLTVSMAGFATRRIDNLSIDASKVLNLPIALAIGQEATVVDVQANGVQTDTASAALVAVIDQKSVQEIPLNGRDFTQMVRFAPGANALTKSVNGSRTSSINYQLDGADNVDPWLGIIASNQGGIASVPGGLIPIEAIEQFSMQSGGEADQGRNAGANSNMVIRSGTNHLHGDVFYFDRNEFFAAISPVAAVGSRKPLIRNHQGGFTVGGPIWRDHTFFFLAGEIQIAKANTAINDTVISDAWISQATANIQTVAAASGNSSFYSVNPLSLNLYHLLYPKDSVSAPYGINNYFANGTSNYNSFNGILKLDHHFSDKQTLSVRYLGTTGKQTAPVSNSNYAQFFQTAPMHIHNFGVVHSYMLNSHILNTVTLATNYFLQTFNDADQNFYPQKNAGLNLGITNPIVAQGSPSIFITGFDGVGATQPSGRTDVTGHITDNFHWTLGKHELKFGGEFRHSNVNQLYFSSSRGTFTFDGSRGNWSTYFTGNSSQQKGSQMADLEDFLIGAPSNSSTSKLLQGNAQRVWTLSTQDYWAQDDFRITKRLNLNYGVRYTVPGAIKAAAHDIYMFVPGANAGFQHGTYPEYYGGAAPRVGFAYSLNDAASTVVRGSYGLFYDFPAMSSWITGTTTNGGAAYAQNNPAGADAAVIYNQTGFQWAVGVNPFVGATAPQVGAYGVNQDFKMPRSSVVSLNVEQQISKSTMLTLGYVGTFGRNLEILLDINQPMANGTSKASPRPYQQTSYPNENPSFVGKPLLAINQLNFVASSNYHSLQATLQQAAWKGLSGTVYYTFSKAMDDASTNTTPMNSYNFRQDYGPSTFDNRHVVNGFVYYTVPQLFHAMPRLTNGWQLNAIFTYNTGTPITPQYSADYSATGELKDRPNYNGLNPYTALQTITSSNGSRSYQFLTNASGQFTAPAAGTYGNEQRDGFTGPNFRTVDFSLFKHTQVTERVHSEFRVEVFNIFNFRNFANPNLNPSSSTFGQITNTRNASAAPGIGVGEPFNIQFAIKFSF